MTIEKGFIDLNELKSIDVFDWPFGYKVTEDEGNKNLVIMPSPERAIGFNQRLEHFSYETQLLLRSKFHFGISHRTEMLEVLYKTFVELYNQEDKSLNDILTLQALYADMTIKLGTILEDFAGMCYACRDYQVNGNDIARVFLTFSDPISFYESIIVKKGKRKIKQIFNLPESKGDLDSLFENLTEEEKDLLLNAIQKSTENIHEQFLDISNSIIRNEKEDVTAYDMYNKLKHGFSPVFPYLAPYPISFDEVSDGVSVEDVISEHFFRNLTIMHDKLPGQRTAQEQQRYEEERLATPTFTYQDTNLESAQNLLRIGTSIAFLYRHLMKKYINLSEGTRFLSLLISEKYMEPEEQASVAAIISDQSRYKTF